MNVGVPNKNRANAVELFEEPVQIPVTPAIPTPLAPTSNHSDELIVTEEPTPTTNKALEEDLRNRLLNFKKNTTTTLNSPKASPILSARIAPSVSLSLSTLGSPYQFTSKSTSSNVRSIIEKLVVSNLKSEECFGEILGLLTSVLDETIGLENFKKSTERAKESSSRQQEHEQREIERDDDDIIMEEDTKLIVNHETRNTNPTASTSTSTSTSNGLTKEHLEMIEGIGNNFSTLLSAMKNLEQQVVLRLPRGPFPTNNNTAASNKQTAKANNTSSKANKLPPPPINTLPLKPPFATKTLTPPSPPSIIPEFGSPTAMGSPSNNPLFARLSTSNADSASYGFAKSANNSANFNNSIDNRRNTLPNNLNHSPVASSSSTTSNPKPNSKLGTKWADPKQVALARSGLIPSLVAPPASNNNSNDNQNTNMKRERSRESSVQLVEKLYAPLETNEVGGTGLKRQFSNGSGSNSTVPYSEQQRRSNNSPPISNTNNTRSSRAISPRAPPSYLNYTNNDRFASTPLDNSPTHYHPKQQDQPQYYEERGYSPNRSSVSGNGGGGGDRYDHYEPPYPGSAAYNNNPYRRDLPPNRRSRSRSRSPQGRNNSNTGWPLY